VLHTDAEHTEIVQGQARHNSRVHRNRHDDVSTIPQNPVCAARGLGLYHFSALVCDLLSRMGVYLVISWKVGPHRSGALY